MQTIRELVELVAEHPWASFFLAVFVAIIIRAIMSPFQKEIHMHLNKKDDE